MLTLKSRLIQKKDGKWFHDHPSHSIIRLLPTPLKSTFLFRIPSIDVLNPIVSSHASSLVDDVPLSIKFNLLQSASIAQAQVRAEENAAAVFLQV